MVFDGRARGRRRARLLELPSCEVLEVARSAGAATLLVPMVKDAIRASTLDARRIEVDLRLPRRGEPRRS